MEYFTVYPSPIGPLWITAEGDKITGIRFENAEYIPSLSRNRDDLPVFETVEKWLDSYFSGNAPDPRELPVQLRGTPFQKFVWNCLLDIPCGKSTTYGSLARLAAAHFGKDRMSAQAIGSAVGRNPIAIVIPCHRCLGVGGKLTGYSGGLDKKRRLLELEQIPYV